MVMRRRSMKGGGMEMGRGEGSRRRRQRPIVNGG
jgi:hypothetical protein